MKDIVEERDSHRSGTSEEKGTRSMRRSRSRSRSPDIGKTATGQSSNKKRISVRDKLKGLRK